MTWPDIFFPLSRFREITHLSIYRFAGFTCLTGMTITITRSGELWPSVDDFCHLHHHHITSIITIIIITITTITSSSSPGLLQWRTLTFPWWLLGRSLWSLSWQTVPTFNPEPRSTSESILTSGMIMAMTINYFAKKKLIFPIAFLGIVQVWRAFD